MVSRRAVLGAGAIAGAGAAAGYGFWPHMGPYEREVARQRAMLAQNPALSEYIRFATLAANGHNTQPWRFSIAPGTCALMPDFTRRTEVVDPDDHHLFISLGCAAENLAIALRANGQSADVAIQGGATPAITVSFGTAPPADTALYQAIPQRQSTRSEYDGQQVSATDIALLERAAAQEGVAVMIFTDAAARAQITDFVVQGNSTQMDDPAFVTELKDWLRFTPDQALATMDGLFAASSGNPVVPAWLASRLFGRFFTKDAENDKYARQISSSAGVAVFVGDGADPAHWINVGRSFQRFALQATALGIRNAHVNQPIEVPSIRPAFADWLGMPDARPDLIVRLGHAPALPMSLRRPPEQLLV